MWDAWNCFCQNLRGVSAEGLAEEALASAKLTDFANVVVRKRHSVISISPFGWALVLVSLTGSPCTASISAPVRRVHASFLPLTEVAASPLFRFCGERPCASLRGGITAHKHTPQNTNRIAYLYLI